MFDYETFFQSRTPRELAVAIVLRAMADNGYLGARAVSALGEPDVELRDEPFPGETGVRQFFMKVGGHQLVTDYQVDGTTGMITFSNTKWDGGHGHVDNMDMIGYWLPAYFPDGKVADRVADWYALADEKMNFK
jgi:hypothetical protein